MDKKRIKRFEKFIDMDNPIKIRLYKPGSKESEKTLKEFFEEEKKKF